MKKFFRFLLVLLLIVVLAVGGLFGWLTYEEYKPAAVESPAPAPITMASAFSISFFRRCRFSSRLPVLSAMPPRSPRTKEMPF